MVAKLVPVSHGGFVVTCSPVLFSFQSCAGFESAAVPVKDEKNAVEDVANEAVNLLWNLW